ncbi:hypothetical protein PIB30_058783 [Stylosanthes scabra]|uniref:Uncharacterized protein n=1 Tax=Stylosanthes scabra TaxID=79078 RepID=A0ABU6VL45_9FABA|nr:hypothetical protein [Stylosanthes scabra]
MKRSKKGGFWTLQVAHATLEHRAVLALSKPSCIRNVHNVCTQLPPLKPSNAFWTELRTQLSNVAYATLRCCNSLNEGQNWNFTFSGQDQASLKPNSTYMGEEQLKHKTHSHN